MELIFQQLGDFWGGMLMAFAVFIYSWIALSLFDGRKRKRRRKD